jgi:hypothetical protein
MARRPVILVLALVVLAVIVALPVVAASPSAAPGKADKAHGPKSPITLTGTVTSSTDGQRAPVFTLRSGGTTYTLEAGPPWFLGDKNPLKAFVGQSVMIVGDMAQGTTEVDVDTVNGKPIRSAGKPPWAGGWKVVGKTHPGWSQDKADRFDAKFGDCFPPGQCKDKSTKANQ